MTETRQPTCEERLPEHLESRLEDMRSLVGWADAWNQTNNHLRAESAERRLEEYPLNISVTRKTIVRLELSYGGPQDYFEAEVDEDGTLSNITYHFLDWFDGAERTIRGDEAETVEQFLRRIMDLDSIEAYIE